MRLHGFEPWTPALLNLNRFGKPNMFESIRAVLYQAEL